MVKMILSLPTTIDAEDFAELATLIVLGRYGKNGFYNGLATPKIEWLHVGNHVGNAGTTIYAIDAEEIDPAFISAVDFLGNFVDSKFYFINGEGKTLSKDWWKPSGKYFESSNSYYYESDAEKAAEEYDEKLQEYWAEKKFA